MTLSGLNARSFLMKMKTEKFLRKRIEKPHRCRYTMRVISEGVE